MSKKVSINFWSIFDRYKESKESPVRAKRVSKDLLEKIDKTGSKIVVYMDSSVIRPNGDEVEPKFQDMLIKAIMKARLEKNNMPFDEVVIDKPKDTDIEIDYKITEHENWESVLIDKLEK